MERLDSGSAVPRHLAGGIVALGNFDGFHAGHQAVVGRAVAWARSEGRPALVATFDPHPIRRFRPDAPPFRLTSIEQRADLFAAAGADAMIVLRFDEALAALSAAEFVAQRLAGTFAATGVVTGQDFTYGRGRAGNVATLAAHGAASGIRTEAVAPVCDAEGPLSSSRIRTALQQGDPRTAARLLTRPFAIRGVVIGGDRRGRELGYPTANIDMGEYLRPAYGIYAVRGRLPNGRLLAGAANLGIRPSFDPPREVLEPHFLDFAGDLYGQEIEVELIEFLRPEARFDSIEALKAQMAADCDRAWALLSR